MDYVTRQEFEEFKRTFLDHRHNGYDSQIVEFINLDGLFRTITDATELTRATTIADRVPSRFSDQIFIDTSTGTKKLYVYDAVGKVWRSCTIA